MLRAVSTPPPTLHEVLPGGATWTAIVRRGTQLTLRDLEGAGTATLTLLRADLTAERLCLPDTLKSQRVSRITSCLTLMSDMGRAMVTVTADGADGHDPLGGMTDDPQLEALLGPSSFQADRNERWVSARTSILVALAKHGLGKADLGDVLQCFSVLDVAEDGALSLRHSGTAGAELVLRCEMDLLACVHVGPHPYDDAPAWPGTPIGLTLSVAPAPPADEPARTVREQTARSLERSDRAARWAPELPPGVAALDPVGGELTWPGPDPLTEVPEAVRGTSVPGGATLAGEPVVPREAIEPPPIEGDIRLDEVIESGAGWLRRVEAGERLRITDLEGNQAVDTLIFCALDQRVRYSWPRTIAAQRNPYLTTGSVLMATEGPPLATMVADTVGRHDTVGGACAGESNVIRYGEHTRYQHSCRDTFVRTLLEAGLEIAKRDVTGNLNFFMHVPIDDQGGLDFADGLSGPGQWFELEFHRPALVLISGCPQLNNPCNAFDPTPVRAQVHTPPAAA